MMIVLLLYYIIINHNILSLYAYENENSIMAYTIRYTKLLWQRAERFAELFELDFDKFFWISSEMRFIQTLRYFFTSKSEFSNHPIFRKNRHGDFPINV